MLGAMSSLALVEIESAVRRYGDHLALDDVGLSIPEGQFIALVGPSGSGKTSLLKSINRLVELDSGQVRLAGKDVRELPLTELRRSIGYVFQGVGLFPH